MKLFLASLFLAVVGIAGAVGTPEPPKTKEHSVVLFENRKVTLEAPEQFKFGGAKDERGLAIVRLADPAEKISVQVTFLPDAEGRFSDGWTRKESLHESFKDYVANSVEKAMQFEELEPRVGAGTYCVFTDVNLVGKATLPPGEYLHATKGVKAWPGVVAIFEIYSNDTTSPEYRAVMKMLRESVDEKPVPLR